MARTVIHAPSVCRAHADAHPGLPPPSRSRIKAVERSHKSRREVTTGRARVAAISAPVWGAGDGRVLGFSGAGLTVGAVAPALPPPFDASTLVSRVPHRALPRPAVGLSVSANRGGGRDPPARTPGEERPMPGPPLRRRRPRHPRPRGPTLTPGLAPRVVGPAASRSSPRSRLNAGQLHDRTIPVAGVPRHRRRPAPSRRASLPTPTARASARDRLRPRTHRPAAGLGQAARRRRPRAHRSRRRCPGPRRRPRPRRRRPPHSTCAISTISPATPSASTTPSSPPGSP